MATSTSNDPSTYAAGTTPTGSEQVLANQSGSLVSLTTAQLSQLSYNSLALWKTYDTVAQMKAAAGPTYPRVKWRGYNYVGDGGGGEGVYVVPGSGTTYTADEGTVFATTAGGFVLRDIPHGDVKTSWFGMTYPSGAAGTPLNPTSSFGTYHPSTDFSPALQAASNFAAAAGRALHIVGRAGSYRLGSSVTLKGVRLTYGDGASLDNMFATQLNWAPTTIVDLAAGLILSDTDQLLQDLSVVMMADTKWPTTVTSPTLISGGQLTVPSGFVWHTDVLPYSAWAPGLAGISVTNRCGLKNVNTLYGKFGVTCNAYVGHIVFDNCSIQGGCAGRFWIQNGQDNFFIGGGSDGYFASELLCEDGFSGTIIRYHQYHTPVGWYQCSYSGTGTYKGISIEGLQMSIESLSEAWIFMARSSINLIDCVAGGTYYAYPVGTSAFELAHSLPDALFANSKRNMYSCGRLGIVSQFRVEPSGPGEISPTGGTGTYSAQFSGFPSNTTNSDFSMFRLTNVDVSYITNDSSYKTNIAWLRNLNALADRSDPATKTRAPKVGNIAVGTNAYSASMGLGIAGNCLSANGGGWSIYNSNSSYPGSAKIDTYQNWLAAGVTLVIPENISRMVGSNPLIIEVTSTGSATNVAPMSLYMSISANNVADGQQGLYYSIYTAGSCGVYVSTSAAKNDYLATGVGTDGGLTFQPTVFSGKVFAKGVTVTETGVNCSATGSKVYIIAPMVNFGSLAEYNPHQHPASLDPFFLASGLRQAGRTFVTTTATGGATTAVTIADFLVAIDATAAAGTVMLPATPFDGEVHVIKKVDATANTVTVNGNGVLIDGASTYVIPGSARGSVRLQYVATTSTPHWYVV
ncbi:hypothetical protein OVY01_21550 [Robbsia sp. Bb-Pol-6]|uniref:Uncharacterized protein n=1 Tax=Robbsia betulipollinis TaxID=2981849 RepID=A0ABT3ZU15_9BURK|nr:hypothetical protein [Robbsia betulipollinis]MCY0389732.1 hypothetical protein [Robbsia betulipollinis]